MRDEKKLEWQIVPCMTDGNKRGWILQSRQILNSPIWITFGYFASIKAAKTVWTHVRRKPIALG